MKGWRCLRILITNHSLRNRAGTELYVRDVATALAERGHEVTAYSTTIGAVGQELRASGVVVTDDLGGLAEPDIIHGQHHLETMTALLRWAGVPAINVCHGSTPWQEAAPRFPRILKYVAVDHACRDRLVEEHAIPPDQIRLILNFVDLKRFQSRPDLPAQPKRALIFSNQASEYTHTGAIRAACERAGIAIDVVGHAAGTPCAHPESILGHYDLVFAKGRSALEALSVGAAVIVCDAAGAGPMVTTDNVEDLRPLNFGLRVLRDAITPEVLSREIARYDAKDAAKVSSLIRRTAGRELVVDELVSLYQEVIGENKRTPKQDLAAEHRAIAAYLRELTPRLQAAETLEAREKQLDMILKSRSWRAISRYSGIKQKLLWPARWFRRSLH